MLHLFFIDCMYILESYLVGYEHQCFDKSKTKGMKLTGKMIGKVFTTKIKIPIAVHIQKSQIRFGNEMRNLFRLNSKIFLTTTAMNNMDFARQQAECLLKLVRYCTMLCPDCIQKPRTTLKFII